MHIVLLGDSIRIGYEPFVREALGAAYRVWGPTENGGDSRNLLTRLREWTLEHKPDVVHLNCGLHDLRSDPDTGHFQIPPHLYKENVREMLQILTTESGASIIWALTTPVIDRWHNAGKDDGTRKSFFRRQADVQVYNRAAMEACREFGVRINDLCSIVEEWGAESILDPDGVHYTPEGYRMLGEAVAGCIGNGG